MKKTIISIIFLLSLGLSVHAQDIYVSQKGNDYTGTGSADAPFKTLWRANLAIEGLNETGRYPDEGVRVIVADDEYYMEKTLILGKNSGGTKDAPVVYTSEKDAVLTAAKSVMTDDLPFDGELIKISLDSMAINGDDIKMLYTDGELLTNSRYPNEGYYKPDIIYDSGTATAFTPGEEKRGFVISYSDPRFETWTNVSDVKINGFPRYLWSYTSVGIASITDGKITSNGTTPYGATSGARFWFENVREELDAPGEWYYDKAENAIYLKPLYDYNHKINIVHGNGKLINIDGAENIVIENLNFSGGSTAAVVNRCKNVKFDRCFFEFFNTSALNFSNCADSGVNNSVFCNLTAGGIQLGGGNRYNLTDGNNFVYNCELFNYGLVKPVSSAIQVHGVGNMVLNTSIHDAFHNAISVGGNNHVLENNEIYNVLVGTDDAGAIYMYSDASCRGNVIKNNYFHHLGTGGERYSQTGISAIYFDGFTSKQTVENNLFYDLNIGIHVNGGGYITIKNNVFADAQAPFSVHSASSSVSPLTFWSNLSGADIDEWVWYEQYPEIRNHYSGDPYRDNVIDNNILIDCGSNNLTENGLTITDTVVESYDIFDSYEDLNFEISDQSRATNLISDFKIYTFSEMGNKQ